MVVKMDLNSLSCFLGDFTKSHKHLEINLTLLSIEKALLIYIISGILSKKSPNRGENVIRGCL